MMGGDAVAPEAGMRSLWRCGQATSDWMEFRFGKVGGEGSGFRGCRILKEK